MNNLKLVKLIRYLSPNFIQEEALSDLRRSLDEAKERELEELRRIHAGDLEQLKLDMMRLTDEERNRLEERMMEERRGVEEMEGRGRWSMYRGR